MLVNMKDMLLPMMLMNGGKMDFTGIDMNNPLMLMALMGGSESKDFFPLMFLMTQKKTETNPQKN